MEDKYRITYDSSIEKAFVVHLPHKKVKFMRHNGLYYHIPTYNTLKSKQTSLLLNRSLESVDENKMFYTNQQVQRANLARQIYHAIGKPLVNDFKMIVTSNMIRNLSINMDDIKIAENIFGPDVGALKGKTTRQKPAPVVSDYIEIPNELIINTSKYNIMLGWNKN